MREALHRVQANVPFNNFTKILGSSGVPFPQELGGDCVDQSRRLREELQAAGIPAVYLEATNRKHIAVLAGDKNKGAYLDPMLYQDEPSCLVRAFRKGVEVDGVVLARPVVEGVSSKVLAAGGGPDIFHVSASSFSKTLGFYSPFWQATFSLDRTFEEVSSSYVAPTLQPPRTFLLRVPNERGEVLEIRRSAFERTQFLFGKMEGLHYASSSADGLVDNPEAMAIVLEISRLVNVEASVILDKMAEATRISMRKHGMGTEGVV